MHFLGMPPLVCGRLLFFRKKKEEKKEGGRQIDNETYCTTVIRVYGALPART